MHYITFLSRIAKTLVFLVFFFGPGLFVERYSEGAKKIAEVIYCDAMRHAYGPNGGCER